MTPTVGHGTKYSNLKVINRVIYKAFTMVAYYELNITVLPRMLNKLTLARGVEHT